MLLLILLFVELGGVYQRGQNNDRGAVLIVVKDGDADVLQRLFDGKTRGGEMSSRLIPLKTGAMRRTVAKISSTSCVSRQMGQASISANALNNSDLPSITGMAA